MHIYEIGVTITPIMAIEILRPSIRIQRNMKPYMIKSFVELMKNGDWRYPNGQCLIFNSDGVLCDGQNRLQAVIDSGIPQKFDICRGIPSENMDSIDSGSSRTHKDLLVMRYKQCGVPIKYASAAASALKYIVSYEQGNIYKCGAGVVPMMVKAAELRHPNIIESVKYIGHRQPWANKSVCISLHYLLGLNPIKKPKVDEFFDKFIDGIGINGKDDPIYVLRRMCEQQQKSSKTAKRPQQHIAWILRIWEHFWKEHKITKISIGDNLPEI